MYLSNTYLEEGFPFHGRKQKQMEAFLKKSGLTPDSFYTAFKKQENMTPNEYRSTVC